MSGCGNDASLIMKQQAAIIGSGIGGIASAIRLAAKGYDVQVFEQAPRPGGKLSERRQDGFRFDTGPSLFTLPELVTELFTLCGKDPDKYFRFATLNSSCKYFWEDGTTINAWSDREAFATEVEEQSGVGRQKVIRFLEKSRRLYDITHEVFLFNSFNKPANFLLPSYRKALLHLHELNAFTTMHKKNSSWFGDERIVQLFDRYATYNGSNPYKTPATLNIIPHLEHNVGAFFPERGMYSTVDSLCRLAREMGVRFHFDSPVEQVLMKGKAATGLQVGGSKLPFHAIVSNVDIVPFYEKLLPSMKLPGKQLKLERSTSALIFYWGVRGHFPNLSLHNILFSKDYEEEFQDLFARKTIHGDPTVYLFISARQVPADAPKGHENWYVMINVPENTGQDWDELIARARTDIQAKIHRVLGIDIQKHIISESFADPRSIEKDTGSHRGSLYGLSSNNRLAAFYRHPNFKKSLKKLYFTGGSVHPGGGIPLCLASAKIIDKEIKPLIP